MAEKIFLNHLQEHFHSRAKSDVLNLIREKSWEQFFSRGLPNKSDEAFRYVSLRDLHQYAFKGFNESAFEKSAWSDHILPECKHSHLVFIDGVFSEKFSDISSLPPQVVLLSLNEAMRSHGSFLQAHLQKTLKEEQDPFALLNIALHIKGAFFYLPSKLQVEVPIQCLHVITQEQSLLCAPKIYITLGAHAKAKWIHTSHCLISGHPHLILPSVDIIQEEGSSLHSLHISETPADLWQMETIRAVLKKNAHLKTLSMTRGHKTQRQSYRIQLKGENSEADLSGLWMLDKNYTAHTHVVVDHEAPHTRSMQKFKGALNGVSHSSFEGKILVRDQAQKTEAYQLNNNLILNSGSLANSKPNLEVFADDVKASHGATVSQLDEDQLFYLCTRGINSTEAKRLLIGGFCREIIEQIPYHSLLNKMQKNLESFVVVK